MSPTTIAGTPLLSPRTLLAGAGRLPDSLSGPSVHWSFSGSAAIWNGIQALSFHAEDEILFPSYHCGAELDAILKAGCRVRFYPVDERLQSDPDEALALATDRTRAVFLIHYFGFPQPMDRWIARCRERNLLVIEDCAHALYTTYQGRPLGAWGDMGVFSLRKFLPVPEGGAFRINRGVDPPERDLDGPPFRETARMLTREIRRSWAAHGGLASVVGPALLAIPSSWGRRVLRLSDPPKSLDSSIAFSIPTSQWGISKVARRLVACTEHLSVINARRRNFERLANWLSTSRTVRPLFTTLPDGVCPWMFPATTEDPASLIAYLNAQGVQVEMFWNTRHAAFPIEAFPPVLALRTHLVAFPIHQSLGHEDMTHLAELIESWVP